MVLTWWIRPKAWASPSGAGSRPPPKPPIRAAHGSPRSPAVGNLRLSPRPLWPHRHPAPQRLPPLMPPPCRVLQRAGGSAAASSTAARSAAHLTTATAAAAFPLIRQHGRIKAIAAAHLGPPLLLLKEEPLAMVLEGKGNALLVFPGVHGAGGVHKSAPWRQEGR